MSAVAGVTRSLVIAPQWVGDAMMTEPLLRRLAQRGEQIAVAALPWVTPVYRAMPQVARVFELPFVHGRLQLVTRCQLALSIQGQFDIAYVCPNSLKSALLPFFAGIATRIGYLGEFRFGLLTHRLPNPSGHKFTPTPMVDFYGALADVEGAASDENCRRPRLQLDRGKVQNALSRFGLESEHYCVLVPGSEYGPAKRWPVGHFADLAGKINLPVVLLGSAKDADLCAAITAQVHALRPGHCLDLSGKTTLEDAMGVVSAAHRLVSNDSGLMHVAAAFDVAQVAIFGSSSPLHTPPLSDRARVLWLKNDPHYQPPLDCAPCFERTCPKGHTRCLTDISVEQVLSCLQPQIS